MKAELSATTRCGIHRYTFPERKESRTELAPLQYDFDRVVAQTCNKIFKHTGWTNKGPAGLEYSGIMEGSHETALMVATYQKGTRDQSSLRW